MLSGFVIHDVVSETEIAIWILLLGGRWSQFLLLLYLWARPLFPSVILGLVSLERGLGLVATVTHRTNKWLLLFRTGGGVSRRCRGDVGTSATCTLERDIKISY